MITKKGTVVKISGTKTIKVEVDEYRTHPKYLKQYKITKRFLAHDEDGKAKIGDVVVIKQVKPYSKLKTWEIITEKTK